jgi:hypothetical protein
MAYIKERGYMPFIPYNEIFVPNTTTKVFINSSGTATQYKIEPDDGYVLHVKEEDEKIWDENYENILGYRERYSYGGTSVHISYDFTVKVPDTYTYTDENGMTVTIPIERIGEQEFYTLPASVVPQNMTYGGGNDHVVASVDDQTEQTQK